MEQPELWTEERLAKVRRLVQSLYATVKALDEEFVAEGRTFTPDGHLVGSIGDVVAAYSFGLTLYPPSTETHDAESEDRKKVQIKLTGGNRSVSLYSEPDYLIVLQLSNGKSDTIYNGPGVSVWAKCGPRAKNGQRSITLNALRKLQSAVPDSDRIVLKRELPDLSLPPGTP